jgi:hypothetical protein
MLDMTRGELFHPSSINPRWVNRLLMNVQILIDSKNRVEIYLGSTRVVNRLAINRFFFALLYDPRIVSNATVITPTKRKFKYAPINPSLAYVERKPCRR